MKKINFSDKFGLTEAVLSGRKTMTRRIIKSRNMIARHWNPAFNAGHCYYTDERGKCQLIDDDTDKIIIPRYKVGEVVAIAQSYESTCNQIDLEFMDLLVSVSELKNHKGWRNKLFVAAGKMLHHIRITDVRIERLQDISDADCLREGVVKCVHKLPAYNIDPSQHLIDYYPCQHLIDCEKKVGWGRVYSTPQAAFASLIDNISGKGAWDSNPYVFAYEFELVD